jgi:hypothetical protein
MDKLDPELDVRILNEIVESAMKLEVRHILFHAELL